ncbi:hypothetical protein GPX89_37060 [Nocardia sp. ET3-3]|uniref:DUF8020 domain-containing protein n=1 Tax=Nocardia terrae TaxID=2675851 RepID=A0A7K1V8M2_9NOCA|nr:hypothetical protein [Nocardia terrae]MVU82832.1 hypothetical protein [Nocardia terrae]
MRRAMAVSALAVGVACGVAAAAPAQANPAPVTAVHGTQSGIAYSASLTPDGVVTTLESGTFTANTDARAVIVSDAAGTPVAAVPLSFTAADREITLTPAIEQNGTRLTLRPTAAPLHDIDSDAQQRWNEQVQRGVFGALIGGAIGGVITIPFWIFVLPPLLGIAIGAGIGFLAAGGQPLIDAGIAYFTGQP